ncbi:TIR domain-containing protein [Streptomyces globisporus]|uniref:toll/interleukin-1 receptor domain-containing protein n=1 Tax=Streptomyces globisporus TaxID=1908 RepID=UPI0004CA389B|nr:TIR domain-containing protein [Streptomyces globisporus]
MERDGFISYSHARDRELAQALQRGMHELARPWTRRQVISVFRDTTSLSASHDLWSSILGELERSRYFIYLASPEAAASRWVQKEIRFWLENRSPDRILIAVGSGAVHWDPAAGDFDWSRTTALPRMLEGVFQAEPLWVDLAEVRRSRKYSLRQAEFRSAVAALAAPLHGRGKDELDSEDIQQRRIALRLLRGAVTVLSLLLVTSLAAGGYAWQKRGEALERARVSASQALAAHSMELADADPRKAAQFALYAEEAEPTSESARALARAVDANSNVARHLLGGLGAAADYMGSGGAAATQVAISGDGSTLAYFSDLGGGAERGRGVHIHDIRKGRAMRSLNAQWALGGGALELSTDGRILMLESAYNRIQIWDVQRGKLLRTIIASEGGDLPQSLRRLHAYALSGDARWVAATYHTPGEEQTQHLTVWKVRTGERVDHRPAPGDLRLSFSADSRLLTALETSRGDLSTWNPRTRGWRAGGKLPDIPAEARSVAFAGSGDTALFGSTGQEEAELWNLSTGKRLASATGSLQQAVLPADGSGSLVAAQGKQVSLLDAKLRRLRTLGSFSWTVSSVAASDDGRWVAAGSGDGAVSLFSADGAGFHRSLPNEERLKAAELDAAGGIAHRSGPKGTELWAVSEGASGFRRLGRIPRPVHEQDGAITATGDGSRVTVVDQGVFSSWDPRTGEQVGEEKAFEDYAPESGQSLRLFYLSDDVHVVTAWASGVLLIDTRTWRVKQVLLPGDGMYQLLAMSGDRKTLAAIDSVGGDVHVWRWSGKSTFEEVMAGGGLASALRILNAAVSHGGERLASVDADGRVSLFDIRTGRVVLSSVVQAPGLQEIVFSRDARTLAHAFTTDSRSGLELWDARNGEYLGQWALETPARPTDATEPALRLASGSGSGVLTLDSGGTLLRRSLDVADWRAKLCQIVDDPLSKADYDRYLSDLTVDAPCRP